MEKMTDKEVLQKAIEIAIDNGLTEPQRSGVIRVLFIINGKMVSERDLIFSHDFAKAFWGWHCSENRTEYVTYSNGAVEQEAVINWMYHLQQMVLEENPIDYLRKFIKDEKTNETH